MNTKYLVDLPFDSASLANGFDSAARYKTNRNLLLALLAGQTRLIQLAKVYGDSYSGTDAPTVLHYRDLLISKALEAALVNCQFADSTNNLLTNQSAKVWEQFSFDEVWSYITVATPNAPLPDYLYAGLLGTPAYNLRLLDTPNLYPTELLEELGKLFWSTQGLTYDQLPDARLSTLISLTNVNDPSIVALSEVVRGALNSDIARRYFITADDITNLPQRLLTGEYDFNIFAVAQPQMSQIVFNLARQVAINLLKLAKPSGMLLVSQNFIVESYLNAALTLNNLPEDLITQNFDYFMTTPRYQDVKFTVANHLALAYDAMSIQSAFNSMFVDKANLKSMIYLWLSNSGQSAVSELYRLPSFGYGFEQLDISEPLDSASVYSSLQGKLPRGAELYTIDTPTFVGSEFNFKLTNFTNSKPLFLQQYLINAPDSSKLEIVRNSDGSYSVSGTPGYGAVYATSDNQPYNASSSVSNVVVIEIPDAVQSTANIGRALSNQSASYNTLFNLDSVSNPRGSASDLYISNGLRNPSLQDPTVDARQAVDDQRRRRAESADRINGVVLQSKKVHVDSELATLQGWAESLGETDCLASYKEAQTLFQSSLSNLQTAANKEDYGNSNSIVKSTAAQSFNAQSVRYTLGTTFDIYAPSTQINSEHVIFTAQNLHTQSKVIRYASTFFWNRAEKVITNETECLFNYITGSLYTTASNNITASGNRAEYADHLSIQIGQKSAPISKAKLGGAYGSASVVAQQDLAFTAELGSLNLNAFAAIRANSTGTVDIKSNLSTTMSSLLNTSVSSKLNLSLEGTALASLTSKGLLTLNALGITTIGGSLIEIGFGASGAEEAVPLTPEDAAIDSAIDPITDQALNGVADAVEAASPTLLDSFDLATLSEGFNPDIPFTLSDSTTTLSNLNDVLPSAFEGLNQSFINAVADADSLTRGFTDAALGTAVEAARGVAASLASKIGVPAGLLDTAFEGSLDSIARGLLDASTNSVLPKPGQVAAGLAQQILSGSVDALIGSATQQKYPSILSLEDYTKAPIKPVGRAAEDGSSNQLPDIPIA